VLPYLEARVNGTERTNRTYGDTIFVPARVSDNAFNNPEYQRVLEGLTGWQRRAWLDGDWDLAAGQFFTTFRRDVHVVPGFDETRAREWFAALDYGFAHFTVVLLGCTDGDGNVFVVDEHAERMWLPQRHGAGVKAMLRRHGLDLAQLRRFVAGADVFSRQADGTTIAQQYLREGIKLRPANMDRVNGWAEILQRLGDPGSGLPPEAKVLPSLFIHQRCGRLVETLPAMQHDPHRPEDVLKVDCDEDGVGGDDAADCLRYLVATKGRAVTQRKLRGV
jgi:phage terminase large subunit